MNSKLRRVPAATWAVAALVLLAALPLGPIRGIARYLVVAYLPGLAIWKHLRSNGSSMVDLVLYPSLLSILPFAWIALACVLFGCDLQLAGWIRIALFLAIGFSLVVVTNVSVVGDKGFDPSRYVGIYEDGDLRVYRVVLGEP